MTPATASQEKGDLRAYLLLRTDLPSLGRGKAAAQAMHCGNHMTCELWVRPLLEGAQVDERVAEWHAQGGGFGTTIALGREDQVTRDAIDDIVSAATALGFLAGAVVDDSYPYAVDVEMMPLIRHEVHTRPPARTRDGWLCCRRETTGCWVLGHRDGVARLLSGFDLAPSG